jgi:hypothetical protein
VATVSDWQALLADWNKELLSDEEIIADLPPEVVQSQWLGFEPASEQQIQRAERRLGMSLPPSYRTFMQTTNGWRMTGHFVYRVRQSHEIDWFRIENKDWAATVIESYSSLEPIADDEYFIYGEGQRSPVYRTEYLLSALQISDIGDSALYLLNPEVQTSTGEWEAWFFANWSPGADRYRSFWEMMKHEYQAYIELKEDKEITH